MVHSGSRIRGCFLRPIPSFGEWVEWDLSFGSQGPKNLGEIIRKYLNDKVCSTFLAWLFQNVLLFDYRMLWMQGQPWVILDWELDRSIWPLWSMSQLRKQYPQLLLMFLQYSLTQLLFAYYTGLVQIFSLTQPLVNSHSMVGQRLNAFMLDSALCSHLLFA